MTDSRQQLSDAIDRFARAVARVTRLPPMGVPINRETLEAHGLRWPLTVDHGHIVRDGNSIYFRSPDGATWALNGPARETHQDIAPIHQVDTQVRDAVVAAGGDPEQTTIPRISLAPLTRIGRDLPKR
ncbi:hypothetical protein NE857_31535 [Nocardiopsis exhalans]|uniref:Uncharacterized protein n=1 Tax=Nocardiopsis exhalans TaxID=163604 RepID=A0ABY5D5Q6_9ACTN|nr:hypothetical protein [Nocardiopsis exhalans]USY19712.1 hypothetical protein NE857_31535 [Nocardiopsis exhalans]